MKTYAAGEVRQLVLTVQVTDTAAFAAGQVHPVYATFAVARDAEWACRQFVLEGKADDEEGIGTFVEVQHHSPAKPGTQVTYTATVESHDKGHLICRWEAHAGGRLLASGRTGQKVLPKEKLEQLFAALG
jgi:predicted thioesterase